MSMAAVETQDLIGKLCKRCGRVLPLSEFSKHRSTKDGLQIYCKDCQKELIHDGREKARLQKLAMKTLTTGADLTEISDSDLFVELKRRGFTGYLTRKQEVSI